MLRAAVAALEEVPGEMLMGAGGSGSVSAAGGHHGGANGAPAGSSGSSSSAANSINPFTAAVAAAADAAASNAYAEGLGGYLSGAGSGVGSLPPMPYPTGVGGFGSPSYGNDTSGMDRSLSMAAAANLAATATTQLQPSTLRTLEGL